MRTHTVIDGNAFYEVDDECMERLRRKERDKTENADIRAAGWNRHCARTGQDEKNHENSR